MTPLPSDLFQLIIHYAFGEPVKQDAFFNLLNLAIDIQQSVPHWFLEETTIKYPPRLHKDNFNSFQLFSRTPLVHGAAFRLFDPYVSMCPRMSHWFVRSLTKATLKKRKRLRGPLFKLVRRPLIFCWNEFLEVFHDLTLDDVSPNGYIPTLVCYAAVQQLPFAEPLQKWSHLF